MDPSLSVDESLVEVGKLVPGSPVWHLILSYVSCRHAVCTDLCVCTSVFVCVVCLVCLVRLCMSFVYVCASMRSYLGTKKDAVDKALDKSVVSTMPQTDQVCAYHTCCTCTHEFWF